MKKLSNKFNNLIEEIRDVEKEVIESDFDNGCYIVRFNCIKQLLDDIRIDLEVKDKFQKEGLTV